MVFQIFLMYPETARKSLEEIDIVFDTNVKPWQTGKISDIFQQEVEHHREQAEKKGLPSHHEEV
jgi:hypothetical protein